ncbi:MAG: hypothetical protein HY791_39610 [Deltaproteobacteria bacterium]|nr:hypothetical protein [Deltaproteobacteria bacterium]
MPDESERAGTNPVHRSPAPSHDRKRLAQTGLKLPRDPLDPTKPAPDLAVQLVKLSRLKHSIASETLALDVQRLEIAAAHLVARWGKATPEERKQLSAIASAKRRNLESLGLIEEREEEDDLLDR